MTFDNNTDHIPIARPLVGFLRLVDVLGPKGPIPVSRSTWWAGVGNGRFPKPVKLGPRITAWRARDIAALIEKLSDGECSQ
jgi:prophage regulatory protein